MSRPLLTPPRQQPEATITVLLRHRAVRVLLLMLWGVGLSLFIPLASAVFWTVLTVAGALVRMELEQRWFGGPANVRRFDRRFILVSVLTCALWSAAPLLIWFSGKPAAAPVAALYMAACWTLFGMQLRASPPVFAIVTAPLWLAALIMVADAGREGGGPFMAAGMAIYAIALVIQSALASRVANEVDAAEAEHRRLIEKFSLAVDSMDAVAWDVDFRARTLHGGVDMARIYGRVMTFEDVTQAGTPLVHPLDKAGIEEVLAAVTPDAPRASSKHRIIRPDGAIVWLRTTALATFNRRGALVRLSGLTFDITNDKRLELEVLNAVREAEAALAAQRQLLEESLPAPEAPEETDVARTLETSVHHLRTIVTEIAHRDATLARMMDDLARARVAAEAANTAKSQFIANMSHELRTPLNAIIGYGEILEEGARERGDGEAQDDLRRVLAAAQRLLHLINDVLDLSKVEAGRMELSPQSFSVAAMVEDAAATIHPLTQANGTSLSVLCAPDLGEAFTDRFRLSQCLLNLLSNAAKFTRQGAIHVSARRTLVDGLPSLEIAVKDDGVGIADDKIGRLFQPFAQADASVTSAYGGTGLGLVITRRLAQLLGGDVSVESREGAGSTFSLVIPVRLPATESLRSRSAA
jgi:signal transduction histidine kinase